MSCCIRTLSAGTVAAVLWVRALAAPVATLPGDCDLDWSVDLADLSGLVACLNGPELGLAGGCSCFDLDEDGDVDLHDVAAFQTAFTGTQVLRIGIANDADDGTEENDTTWHANGLGGTGRNQMGAAGGSSYEVGLRFLLPEVRRGETFVYARLVVPATDDGQVDSQVTLRIVGVDQGSPAGFDVNRPSQLPKTTTTTEWQFTSNWPGSAGVSGCRPLQRYSPDLSPIINEILSRPDWGSGPEGKTLALVIEDDACTETNFLTFEDYRQVECLDWTNTLTPTLELYRTVRSTFIGTELLGRPTDHSVTVSALSLLTLEVYFEFGSGLGTYPRQTSTTLYPAQSPIEVVLDGLLPNTRHFYRIRHRRPGEPAFTPGRERTFHTQRPPGEAFTFTVQADSHLRCKLATDDQESLALYRLALSNALSAEPDFHIDLGDTFMSEVYMGRDVVDFEEAVSRHVEQRPFLGLVCHSAPFFLVLGNHEGEQGWRLDGSANNLAVWATNARKLIYPLPAPDDFYCGSQDEPEYVGLRENYYAWQWGDALFVVLDPYWYTTTKPHSFGGTAGSEDNWDWTFGQQQYLWFRDTLESSSATFKFVFSHQVTGGVNPYGRGGIEAASHALGGWGSFEWGGEDACGNYVFDSRRPGWGLPVHQVMADNNVTVFFHGHDHVFVKQELDGVVYQECPHPIDTSYGQGWYSAGGYLSGDQVNNSGHLQVAVAPSQVTVAYVRAFLPGDGPDGAVAYSYSVLAP